MINLGHDKNMIKTWLKRVGDDMKMQKNYAKSILWIKHTLYAVVMGEKTN